MAKITVFNKGARTYHLTGKRTLGPQQSAEVEGDEAKLLLGMRDIVDAAKVMPATKKDKKLEAENDALAKENAELKKKLAGKATAADELAEDDEVVLADGKHGLVVKVNKGKKEASVQLEDGTKATLALSDLKKV